MVTKKQLIKTTVRYDAHIAPAIAIAARREGLSQNEWIVSAIQAQLEVGQREREEAAHTALLFERLHKLQRRMDGMMELFLVFTRFLFAIIPEVADGAQPRLNVLGKQRAAALIDEVVPRLQGDKPSFLAAFDAQLNTLHASSQTQGDAPKG